MLNMMLKWRKKNSKGFSLVELIIVIAIMAILVGILAPQFIKYVNQSRESTDIKNMQEVISAIQVYCADSDETHKVAALETTIQLDTAGLTLSTTTDKAGVITKALTNAGLTAANIKGKSTTYTGAAGLVNVKITNNVVEFYGSSALAVKLGLPAAATT